MRFNLPLTVILGAAAGYVAGSAAGRRRYEQIRSAAGSFVNDPTVRDTASRVASTATTAGAATVHKAMDVAGAVKEKVDEHRDTPDEAPASL